LIQLLFSYFPPPFSSPSFLFPLVNAFRSSLGLFIAFLDDALCFASYRKSASTGPPRGASSVCVSRCAIVLFRRLASFFI
jgi:hypothetical protein